jgi:predicted ATPase
MRRMGEETRSTAGRASGRLFVGRERELAELRAGFEEALAGRGRLYLITGEPGIGKTRLAEELSSSAQEQGASVLWGRCCGSG